MANKKQTNKTITLSEFHAWLDGVEELQAKSWVPDASQWRLIRNKIKLIVPDTQPAQAPTHQPSRGYSQPPAQAQGLPPGIAPMPDIPSSIPSDAVLGGTVPNDPTVAGQQTGPDGRLITPDIDTTDGNYNSTFL